MGVVSLRKAVTFVARQSDIWRPQLVSWRRWSTPEKSVKVQFTKVMLAFEAVHEDVDERSDCEVNSQPDLEALFSESPSNAVQISEERKRGTCRKSKKREDGTDVETSGWKKRSREEERRARDVWAESRKRGAREKLCGRRREGEL
jgi:hypothetical protein